MILGRVVGSFWSTAQHFSFHGRRLVLIVPWDALSDETLPGGYDYKLLSANQHDNFFIVKMQSIEQQLSATR